MLLSSLFIMINFVVLLLIRLRSNNSIKNQPFFIDRHTLPAPPPSIQKKYNCQSELRAKYFFLLVFFELKITIFYSFLIITSLASQHIVRDLFEISLDP
jgi:hypothetical protein